MSSLYIPTTSTNIPNFAFRQLHVVFLLAYIDWV